MRRLAIFFIIIFSLINKLQAQELSEEEYFENKVFCSDDGDCGIISQNGEIIISPSHRYLSNLNSYFFYHTTEKKERIEYWLDLNKKKLVQVDSDLEYVFCHNGFNLFRNKKNDKVGILNDYNQLLIPFEYDMIEQNEKYWFAYNDDEQGKRKPIILDKNYKILPPNSYTDHRLSGFDTLIAVMKDNKWGFLNNELIEITPFIYGYFRFVTDRLTLVGQNKEGKTFYGFLDNDGKIIVPIEYDYLSNVVGNDLIIYGNNKKYGYISTKGEIAVKAQFIECENFNEGYAFVTLDKYNYGIIDITGAFIIKGTKKENDIVTEYYKGKDKIYEIMNLEYNYKGDLLKK